MLSRGSRLAVLAALWAFACGGKNLDVGSGSPADASGSSSGGSSDSSVGGSSGGESGSSSGATGTTGSWGSSGGTGGSDVEIDASTLGLDGGPLGPLPASDAPPFTAAEVAAAVALCDEAHGPVSPFTTPSAEAALLVGSWLQCNGPDASGILEWPGIEFKTDGSFSTLIPDPAGSGGFVEGLGVLNQGSWNLCCGGDLSVFGQELANGSMPGFETSPQRMYWPTANPGWFVPLVHQ